MKKDQVEEHAKKIQEQFDILEKFLTENKFMAGEHVSMGHPEIGFLKLFIIFWYPIETQYTFVSNYRWPLQIYQLLPLSAQSTW